MAHRKSQLKLDKQDVAIDATVRTAKLDPEEVLTQPDVVRRDQQTGGRVHRETYDKATGERLAQGYGYRYVTDDGTEVPSDEIEFYRVSDGEEEQFALFEPTLGGERTITPVTWIPIHTVDRYLIERTYELWGEDAEDARELYRLAQLIRDYGEAPVIEVVLRESTRKSWGIITPQFFQDSFSLILRITRQRIEPEHRMPTFAADEDAPRLEQEDPFESAARR